VPSIRPSDFDLYLRDLLRDGDVPTEIRQQAELLQSQLASPGEWEAAKFQPPDSPDEPQSPG
jgi:hypothetical protein